jgi:hypothetical protein
VVYKALRFNDVNTLVAGVPAGYSYSGGLEAGLVIRF